nr:hypothetical protein [Diaporthe sp.]
MTFFVRFSLLLRFLIKSFFIAGGFWLRLNLGYCVPRACGAGLVKVSSNKGEGGVADNSSQKKSSESNANQQTAPQHILDLQEEHDRIHKQRKEDLANWKLNQELLNKEKKSKQDSSDVVNDGSEPTPLTDLDGGD